MLSHFLDIFQRHTRPLDPIPTGLKPEGAPRHPVKAVLFDVYGTLLISASGDLGGIRDAGPVDESVDEHDTSADLLSLKKAHGISYSPEKLLKAYLKAVEADHARNKKRGIDFPEIRIDKIWAKVLGTSDMAAARRFALEFELIINPVHPMPGLKETLKTISHAGIRMGIISNAQFYTPLMFGYFCGKTPEKIGFDPDLCIYSYRCGHAKPSPVLFGAAADRLLQCGIDRKNVLFVGNDMRNDIAPAKASGFQAALFAGDRRSLRLRRDDPHLSSLIPELVVTELPQIPARIGLGRI